MTPLTINTEPGRLVYDATYLPRPDFWPPELPWNGQGLRSGPGYRYGPALVRTGANQLHLWSCSEGDNSFADYIRYRYSANGGSNWTDDVIALAPTFGSADGWAVCDPNVIKIGTYYYMAYTATSSPTGGGRNNQIFLARSTQLASGYQKWNGTGWGGNPAPIVRYSGAGLAWGVGEPNMVLRGNTLFLYYTEDLGVPRTRVATVDVSSSTWPRSLVQRGYAIANRDPSEDQTDVKYLPEVNRFIALGVGNRFTNTSYVHAWQSSNGLTFQPLNSDVLRSHLQVQAHNLGLSGNFSGHSLMGTKEYIAYAYTAADGGQGVWNTWLNPVTINGAGFTESIRQVNNPNAMSGIIQYLMD